MGALQRAQSPFAPRSRRSDMAELALAYLLVYAVEWTPRPWQKYLWWVAALAIAWLAARSFEGMQAAGMCKANLLRSSWPVGVSLLIALVSFAIGARLHTLRFTGGPLLFLENYWAYALWAGVQQFLLQCFFLARLNRILPAGRRAALAAAGLFALAHVPNPLLIAVTMVWGLAACLLFLRYRNLWTLAMAHAILGITIAVTIPGPMDHNMRVGLSYLRYRPAPQRSQSDHSASTVAWVTADAPTRRSRNDPRPYQARP